MHARLPQIIRTLEKIDYLTTPGNSKRMQLIKTFGDYMQYYSTLGFSLGVALGFGSLIVAVRRAGAGMRMCGALLLFVSRGACTPASSCSTSFDGLLPRLEVLMCT